MGTVVTIDVYTGPDLTDAQVSEVRLAARPRPGHPRRADEIFSTWQPRSPVSRLRSGRSLPRRPLRRSPTSLSAARPRGSCHRGWFDPWAMPGGVDPTGYVKGWAAQQALAAFTAPWIAGAMVNAAGDIATAGGLAGGQPFRVGIADPAAPRRLAEIVELAGAIATSGSYERGDHLIDPHSGHPAARVASASVTGPTSAWPTRWPPPWRWPGEPGLAFIQPIEGYEALIIGHDGSRRWTERFPLARRDPAPPHSTGRQPATSSARPVAAGAGRRLPAAPALAHRDRSTAMQPGRRRLKSGRLSPEADPARQWPSA